MPTKQQRPTERFNRANRLHLYIGRVDDRMAKVLQEGPPLESAKTPAAAAAPSAATFPQLEAELKFVAPLDEDFICPVCAHALHEAQTHADLN